MPQPEQLTIEQAISRAKKAAKRGNREVATQFYQAVLQQQPNHPLAKKGLRKLQKESRLRQPVQTRTTDPSKSEIDALIELCRLGHMARAEQSCEELLQTYPQSVLVTNVLGVALQRQGKLSEAVRALDRAIELKPDFAEAYCNRGIALKELGHLEKAVASFDSAVRYKPEFADAYFNRGNAQREFGRFEDALASYEKAVQLKPDFAQAYRSLGTLKHYEEDDARIGLMESLYANPGTHDEDRMEICFALAKAHEDLGDYDKGFKFLREGNQIRKQALGYDIESDKQLFARIKEDFAAGGLPLDMQPDEGPSIRPVFIVGMMRSGTSLVEQILASHSQVHGAGELEAMNQRAGPMLGELSATKIRALRSAYLDALAGLKVPERIITDKMPLNFRWIGFILSAFPEAKIVHLRRDPRATCWSIYKHYFPDEGNGYAFDMGDLADYYELYVDLMSFWHERFPDSICDVCYEDLTEKQEEETRKLLEFCDLEWEDQCLDFHKAKRAVRTSSAAQVRKEIYRGSSEAWKKYEQHLQPLVDRLAHSSAEPSSE
jgi:tetratricopeptide (TPR) repeat protein